MKSSSHASVKLIFCQVSEESVAISNFLLSNFCTQMWIHTQATHVCTYVHMHTHTHTQTHQHARMCTHTLYIATYTQTYIQIHTRTDRHIRAHTHTPHTHIHSTYTTKHKILESFQLIN